MSLWCARLPVGTAKPAVAISVLPWPSPDCSKSETKGFKQRKCLAKLSLCKHVEKQSYPTFAFPWPRRWLHQAKQLADWLKNYPSACLFCSLLRCKKIRNLKQFILKEVSIFVVCFNFYCIPKSIFRAISNSSQQSRVTSITLPQRVDTSVHVRQKTALIHRGDHRIYKYIALGIQFSDGR